MTMMQLMGFLLRTVFPIQCRGPAIIIQKNAGLNVISLSGWLIGTGFVQKNLLMGKDKAGAV
jgi:hypothetical protein